jgi:DNA-directed RNA polymerase subunit RPC12/RpoP
MDMNETGNPEEDRLEQAYNGMLQKLSTELEALPDRSAVVLNDLLESARSEVLANGQLTTEEADTVTDYLRRDLHDLGTFLGKGTSDWRDWLRMDIAMIEAGLLNALSSVADRTKVELAELAARAYRVGEWHTGEITGPGELTCLECEGTVHLSKVGRIPPCPHCRHTRFHRGGPAPEGSE